MELRSRAFAMNESIPTQYTCDGKNTSPPLEFDDVPANAKSMVLIVDDPDIPKEVQERMDIKVFDHWVAWNIMPQTKELPEGYNGATEGLNSGGKVGYTGPCPPKEYEPTKHRYFFKLYALDISLDLAQGSSRKDVVNAMHGHILATAELVGVYERT